MNSPSNKLDIELGRVRDGYPALAAWIARADAEAFVFRKFDRMAARNILHLQCRLIALEHEIDSLDEVARSRGDDESKQSSRRWETLMKLSEDVDRPETKRVEKLDELKTLLEEYQETILRQTQIAKLKGPSGRVVKTFRDYVDGKAFVQDVSPTSAEDSTVAMRLISGRAKHFLEDKLDLVAIRRGEEDQLSKLLQQHWIFQERKTNDPFDRTTISKFHHIERTVAAVSMMLAAILLIVAIISLYSVSNPKAKLGLVAMYTLLFAVSVALLTNARRAEVFAATAAYAAVLVVFVSGNIGGVSEGQCLIQQENGVFRMIQCPG